MRGSWGQSWPDLTRKLTVTLEAGRRYYALPDGFEGLVIDTAWETNNAWPALGPASPAEWQILQNRDVAENSPSVFYRVTNDPSTGRLSLEFHPLPATGTEVSLVYVSNHWIRLSDTSPPTAARATIDTHIPVFDADLLTLDLEWRIRSAEGLAFAAQLGEFENERDRLFAQLTGDAARAVNLAVDKRLTYNVSVDGRGLEDVAAIPSTRTHPGETVTPRGGEFSDEFSQEFD